MGSVFLIMANVFLVWSPILIREAIDAVEQMTETNAESLLGKSVMVILFQTEMGAVLAHQALMLTLVVLAYGALLFATRQTLIVTSRKIEFDIRNEIFDKLQRLPQSFYARTKQSDIYVKATEDVNRVREYFGPAFMYTINTISRAGIIIGMMLIVNVELTLWALLPLPALSFLAYWMSGFIHTKSIIIQEQYSRLAGKAQEVFSSIRLIKAYAREDYELATFAKESESYRKKKLGRDFVESLFFPMLNLLIGFSIILVVWQGGIMVSAGKVTIGNIAEFIIYVLYLTWPVASLGYTINLIQRSAASQKRIAELMNEVSIPSNSKNLEGSENLCQGDVVFENVSFKYPGATEYALKNVSLRIPSKAFVGIVGKTGSGKTTLISLLCRLFEPETGRILVGGRDLKDIPLELWRNHVGAVPQDVFLFSDTIQENIAFGGKDASIADVEKAAQRAQVLDNIMEFDKKFDTMLGERGITLSGGQKQRTSIARALIRNPKMLILDDSLSAVDTKTEEAILQQLRGVIKELTSVVISHRFSTIQQADIIYVLDEGQVVEQGTHKELVDNKKIYHSIYTKQILEKELQEI